MKKIRETSYAVNRSLSPIGDAEDGEHCEVHLQTQKSVNFDPWDENQAKEEEEGSDGSDGWMFPCQYDPVKAAAMRMKEQEDMKKIFAEKKKKPQVIEDRYEGDTDVEDLFTTPCDESDYFVLEKPMKKKVKRQGPTLRSHS
jgi:hypothetical protein